jgi:hypothetical protein
MVKGRGWWEEPVPVMLGDGGTIHNVSNNLQAANILLHHWPKNNGRNHLAARKLVLAAMENLHDRVKLAEARNAFAQAAKEAKILVK